MATAKQSASALLLSIALALLSLATGCSGNPDPAGIDSGHQDGATADDATPSSDAGANVDATESAVDCESIWQWPGHGTSFYEDNPTYIDPVDDSASWTFSSPEAQGMDSAALAAAVADLEGRPYVRSFLVLRNGAIVLEQYLHGSDASQSNNVHSASKSILSALAGIAIEQGHIASLDEPVADILPTHFADVTNPAKRDITVRHLLTMSAGFAWEEDQTEYAIDDEPDWVQAIVDLPLQDTPGDQFNYSTGQAHLLAAAVTEATGLSLCEFAHTTLFAQLGITAEHWGRDPQSYFSGGYNLYLTPRELAKFGLLQLARGNWGGTQVVPQSWADANVERHMNTGGGYHYGYMWWLVTMSTHDVYIAWGWGGQLVYVIPDLDIVAVITTNTRDYSVDFDGRSIVEDYLIPSVD